MDFQALSGKVKAAEIDEEEKKKYEIDPDARRFAQSVLWDMFQIPTFTEGMIHPPTRSFEEVKIDLWRTSRVTDTRDKRYLGTRLYPLWRMIPISNLSDHPARLCWMGLSIVLLRLSKGSRTNMLGTEVAVWVYFCRL